VIIRWQIMRFNCIF